jgi:uncharacterized protein YndB with AHSA1/START domain
MIRVARSVLIKRSPALVFERLFDPRRFPAFFAGVTRWEPLESGVPGVGARYLVLMRVASVQVGGVVRILEWDPPRSIQWTSERGVDQTGRFRVEPTPGGSLFTIEIAYALPGARSVAWLAGRIGRRIVDRHVHAAVLGARRLVEFELEG